MNGVLQVWLAAILAAITLSIGSATVFGQQVQQPWGTAAGVAYSPAAYPGEPATDLPADWENWKADVDARLQAIADKEAAAKKTAAGSPSVKVGGRIQADWALFDQSPNNRATYGDWGDRCEFRRARIFVAGEAFYVVDYKLQMDFADNPATPTDGSIYTGDNQSTSFKDVYITVNELPWLGHVRVGHFKEPFGLEFLTSSNFITFMERSLCDENAIVPGRNMGVMVFDHSQNERMTWAIGAFKSEIGSEPPIRRNQFEGGTALTMRGTFLPWYDEATDGRGLLHLGAAYSYRDLDDDTVQIRTQPEAHLAGTVLDTGSLAATNWQIAGGEAALVYGPFSIQSELFGAWIDSPVYGDVQYSGTYVYVSYFLTGEHRAYKRTEGVFTRVKPFENFFRVRDADGYTQMGLGAWEIAYRYSTLDLNDVVAGGRAYDHTLGLNWYLNPYTRLMFNYVNANISADHRDGTNGSINIFETRAQIDF
jgi:phosphate-selective porin OprO/OprP